MAKTFDKPTTGGDRRCLIVGGREALVYPFPFEDWTTIRMGMFISYTNGSADNIDMMSESGGQRTVDIVSTKDRIFWGATSLTGDVSAFPAERDQPFIGIMSNAAKSAYSINNSSFPGSISFGDATFTLTSGTHHANRVITQSTLPMPTSFFVGNPPANNMGTTSAFCSYFGFVMSVNNKGQANQTINLRTIYDNSFTDVSDASLKAAMTGASYNNRGDCEWQLSGLPYKLPNAFFLYLPFNTLRMRIHNIGVMKLA